MPRPALGLFVALAAWPMVASGADQPAQPAGQVIVELKLKGHIGEDPAPIGLDGATSKDNLRGIVDRIKQAAKDDRVKGLVLKIDRLSIGLAKANELRTAIQGFRASGKKVRAYLEAAGNVDYLVAAAADEVVMPESGTLMLKGLAAEVTFYRAMFDKLGITSDTLQVGEHKGTGEPFTRYRMSAAFRQELASILNDARDQMAEAIAARLKMTPDEAKARIDGGPYHPAAAKQAGLIDRVAYADEVEASFKAEVGGEVAILRNYGKAGGKADLSGLAGLMKMMQALSGEPAKRATSDKPKVAIIYASGAITSGKSSGSSALGGSTMGSDTICKAIRTAAEDATVKAVVLRVDSPGGSALASDLIWREVDRLDKPVIASMSDTAASGGYYISMGADKIYADPGTLTGSIGVVGIKIALEGLLEKVGLATETVTVGKNGTINSLVAPYRPDEKAAALRLMTETYRLFVDKVARGRKLPVATAEGLASGRVYTGRQAKAKGLVDELGTLDDALAAAKGLAKLGTDDNEVRILPEPVGLLESLFGALDDSEGAANSTILAGSIPGPARAILARLGTLTRIFGEEPAVLALPFDLQIR